MALGFTPQGDEFLVNSYTTSGQLFPSVTGLADGGFVVTWVSDGQDGTGTGVYGQRYDASGAVVGDEFRVNTYTTSYQDEPSVSSFADGGFVVTWKSYGQADVSWDIFGQRYDASGVAVGDEFQINTTTTGDQFLPSVTTFTDGGFVVTWTATNVETGNDTDIVGQRYDAAGTSIGGEFQINTYTATVQAEATVTALSNGGFVVTWKSDWQDDNSTGFLGSEWGIFGQRYDANGAAVGDEFQINTYTTSAQEEASVTALADGGFVVTWQSDGQDGSWYGIYGQRYDASGVANGGEFQINTTTLSNQFNPSVTSLADGGFVVTWSTVIGLAGNFISTFGQRYDAAGATIGGEFQVNTFTDGSQGLPSVASLVNGGFVVTWMSEDQDGSGYGIYGQQFAPQLFGTSAGDVIMDTVGANWINGQGGDDVLRGKTGQDSIYGGAGKDKLFGGNGDDKLKGGAGRDTLKGGKGNDKLIGGAGKDVMTGGADADTFVFRAASNSATNGNADIIKDFEVGLDHIDLSALGVSYIGSAGFSGAAEVRTTEVGGNTLVRVDVDGDGSVDMKVVVEGITGLSGSDFIL